jgi:hypothetical protein
VPLGVRTLDLDRRLWSRDLEGEGVPVVRNDEIVEGIVDVRFQVWFVSGPLSQPQRKGRTTTVTHRTITMAVMLC